MQRSQDDIDRHQTLLRPSCIQTRCGPNRVNMREKDAVGNEGEASKSCLVKIQQPKNGILAASYIAMLLNGGALYNAGVLYVIFLEALHEDRGTTAWIGSVQMAVFFLVGPAAAGISNRYSCRTCINIGGLLAGGGYSLSYFGTSVYYLIVTCGVLAGAGLGLMYTSTVIVVGHSFKKGRTLATGVSTSAMGIGWLAYPFLSLFLEQEYGWRGMVLVIGAINFNIIVCGFLMNPQYSNEKNEENKSTQTLDITILKNASLDIACLSMLLFCFGYSMVSVHLPAYAETLGFSHNEGAWLLAIMGVANMIGRIVLGVIGNHVNIILAQGVTFMISGGAMMLYVICNSYASFAACVVLYGFCSAGLATYVSIIVMMLVGLPNMASGMGFMMMSGGIGILLGGPVGGWLFDITKTYTLPMVLGGSIALFCGAIMVIPYLIHRRMSKNQTAGSEKPETIYKKVVNDPNSDGPAEGLPA